MADLGPYSSVLFSFLGSARIFFSLSFSSSFIFTSSLLRFFLFYGSSFLLSISSFVAERTADVGTVMVILQLCDYGENCR